MAQGPTLGNANIEVVQAIHICVPGEPGNEAYDVISSWIIIVLTYYIIHDLIDRA